MTKKELLNKLKDIDDDVSINFYLLPDDEGLRDESDEHDESLEFVGDIYSGGLDSDEPFLDIGLERTKK